MNIYEEGNNLVLSGVKDFLLSQTLECGQCFHFEKKDVEEYKVCAYNHVLHIRQDGELLRLYDTTIEDYESIWENYFDFKRDYAAIKETLLEKNSVLKPAIDAMWGVRILNQDFFETLISFIISQNQQIPRIKRIISDISYNHGKRFTDTLSAFPDCDVILKAGEEKMRDAKAGFRAPYIIDACEKIKAGIINENVLRKAGYDGCIEQLKLIKGVGDKVANCTALFSLGYRNAFPVDVWIKRVMESLYFNKEVPPAEIMELAKELYGEYGGYAQQYLFYFGKINEIGKKTRKREKKWENTIEMRENPMKHKVAYAG